MKLLRFLVILTITLIIIMAIVVWFSPTVDDFRSDNPSWNGIMNVSSTHKATPLATLSYLPTLPHGSTLIIIPYLDFTPTDLEGIYRFVSQGGTLVLADDYGFGNQILEYMGLKVQFSGQPLLDPLMNYKNKRLPQISHIIASPITGNTESLTLNHATSLIYAEAGDTLALSSPYSFLDLNDNEALDEGEPTGPLPVISQHNLSSGRIILIADPSIFINSMANLASNRIFVQNIAAITTSELLIDQSHLPPTNLHQTKSLLASIRDSVTTPAGAVSLVILALTITLIPIWYERSRR